MHNTALRERRRDKHPWYTEASFDLAETGIVICPLAESRRVRERHMIQTKPAHADLSIDAMPWLELIDSPLTNLGAQLHVLRGQERKP
jgi:hypothetical protein